MTKWKRWHHLHKIQKMYVLNSICKMLVLWVNIKIHNTELAPMSLASYTVLHAYCDCQTAC